MSDTTFHPLRFSFGQVLGVIAARAGSKGVPNKNTRLLLGRPAVWYTLDDARASRRLTQVVVSTNDPAVKRVAEAEGVRVIDRPADLATDTARIDGALQHAVNTVEAEGWRVDAVVLLYANVPVRAPGIIDRVIEHLAATGADSVRTFAPVGKYHPAWMSRLDGDRVAPFQPGTAYRRQDLEPLYIVDGAAAAMTRAALFSLPAGPDDHFAYLGRDRRGIIQTADATVDIDTEQDLLVAEAALRKRRAP
jgi:CMP-N,N'-diacetyllegionaminic acid synthase